MFKITRQIITLLKNKKLTLSLTESCTGGMLAQYLTSVSGASKVFKLGVIAYSNQSKIKYLQVPSKIIKQYGAVSEECCYSMLYNLSKISKSLKQEQKKYSISLCGGDTTFSNKLSFSITSVGFSKNIIFRNNAKLNDDIYVTGNLGDSFVGLHALKNKIKLNNKEQGYFINKYYKPDIQVRLSKKLFKFARTAIDVSDGLISDLEKMINKQNLSYRLNEYQIPISKKLSNLIKTKKIIKSKLISNGDDYQVLFTADPDKNRIIQRTSRSLGIKITKIGKIIQGTTKSVIIDQKGKQILIKNKGYTHQF